MSSSIKKGAPAKGTDGIVMPVSDLSESSDLLDTTANVSYVSDANDAVWGEATFSSLWDDADGDVFDFSTLDSADSDMSGELQAGDKIALHWGESDSISSLTLVIGPTFNGAGQLIIHADGKQTFIATDSTTDDSAASTGGDEIVAGSGGGDS